MEESSRRRSKQLAYNETHGIIPQSVVRRIDEGIMLFEEPVPDTLLTAEPKQPYGKGRKGYRQKETKGKEKSMKQLEREMLEAARLLQFEKAARIRDIIETMRSTHG